MSYLEIKNLSYTYPGGIKAVDGLDLSVDKGEYLAMIGSNAAGKSTLALLVKGVLTPDSGSIMIDGRKCDTGIVDPRVGLLFSNPENQLVTSIVEEDVAFGLEVAGMPSTDIQQKVASVLAALGIEHLRDRMPHRLSGGEQQMTALAGIMVTEPDLLILDEPTAYLDPVARAAVIRVVRSLAQKGTTVILITHDITRAAGAQRIVVMETGKVVRTGTPRSLLNPASRSSINMADVPFSIKLVYVLEESGITVPDSTDPASLAQTVASIVKGRSIRIFNTTTDTTAENGNEIDAADVGEEIASSSESALPPGLSPILSLEGASFSYPGQGNENQPGQSTVHDVDLLVPEGAVTLLCGPNGSGKSTMLQMCNGLIRPDSGKVLFKGKELVTLKKQKGGVPGKVALLFQNPERQLFSDTVFDDVAFGPRNLGLDPEEVARRVSNSMKWVGLGDELAERPVHSLSGGQMRRVGIAGVLAMEAELLVLDEPTDGLDPIGVQEFYTQARKYCESTGTTILMAAHEIPEQIALVDHLFFMDGGKMMFSGSPGVALTGLDSCVPPAFLPDHLVIRQELERHGVAFSENDLSPERVLARIVEALNL